MFVRAVALVLLLVGQTTFVYGSAHASSQQSTLCDLIRAYDFEFWAEKLDYYVERYDALKYPVTQEEANFVRQRVEEVWRNALMPADKDNPSAEVIQQAKRSTCTGVTRGLIRARAETAIGIGSDPVAVEARKLLPGRWGNTVDSEVIIQLLVTRARSCGDDFTFRAISMMANDKGVEMRRNSLDCPWRY